MKTINEFSNRDWLSVTVSAVVSVALLALVVFLLPATQFAGSVESIVHPAAFNFITDDVRTGTVYVNARNLPDELVEQVRGLSEMENAQLIDVLQEFLTSAKSVTVTVQYWRGPGSVIATVLVDDRPYADVLDDAINERVERYEYCNPPEYCEDGTGVDMSLRIERYAEVRSTPERFQLACDGVTN